MKFATREYRLQNNCLILGDDEWDHMGIPVIWKHKNELGRSTRILQDGSVPPIHDQIRDLADLYLPLLPECSFFVRIPGDFHGLRYHN